MADTEYQAVAYTVIGIERVRSGAMLGFAIVEVDIGGVVITLQGVQIARGSNGGIEVRAPRFRDGEGTWRSAILLPESLQAALATELLEVFMALS